MADVLPGGPYGRLGLVTNDLPRGWCPHAEMANWEVLPRSLMPAYVVVMGESMDYVRRKRKHFNAVEHLDGIEPPTRWVSTSRSAAELQVRCRVTDSNRARCPKDTPGKS